MGYVRNVRKIMCMWVFNAYPRKWLYLVVTFIALMENVNFVKMGLICSKICACLLRKFKSLCLLKLWVLMVPLVLLWKALLKVVNLYKVLSVLSIILLLLILRSKPIFNNNNPIPSEGKKMIWCPNNLLIAKWRISRIQAPAWYVNMVITLKTANAGWCQNCVRVTTFKPVSALPANMDYIWKMVIVSISTV